MSTSRRSHALPDAPPFVGALLRLSWQRTRVRIDVAVRDAGFTDLQQAHLGLFQYPAPDAVRPSDLARRLRMSRQAMNHLLRELEALDYLERRTRPGSTRRVVHLTDRGRRVYETIYDAMRALQGEWASEIGHERFADFMDILRRLAADTPG